MLTKDYLEYVFDENTYFVKIVDIIFSIFLILPKFDITP